VCQVGQEPHCSSSLSQTDLIYVSGQDIHQSSIGSASFGAPASGCRWLDELILALWHDLQVCGQVLSCHSKPQQICPSMVTHIATFSYLLTCACRHTWTGRWEIEGVIACCFDCTAGCWVDRFQ
jgi:hypothetical protein